MVRWCLIMNIAERLEIARLMLPPGCVVKVCRSQLSCRLGDLDFRVYCVRDIVAIEIKGRLWKFSFGDPGCVEAFRERLRVESELVNPER